MDTKKIIIAAVLVIGAAWYLYSQKKAKQEQEQAERDARKQELIDQYAKATSETERQTINARAKKELGIDLKKDAQTQAAQDKRRKEQLYKEHLGNTEARKAELEEIFAEEFPGEKLRSDDYLLWVDDLRKELKERIKGGGN